MRLVALISLAMLATPALAESYSDYLSAQLDQTVRDTDTGVRANVKYFNDVLTGGRDIIVDEDGTEHELHWDGWKGVFEVAVLPGALPPNAEAFVRDAVAAVCPSVDRAGLTAAAVRAQGGGLFQIDAQCPAIDARSGN